MIEQLQAQAPVSTGQKPNDAPVFRMVKSDRMAGSVPCWEKPSSMRAHIEQNLSYAAGQATSAAPAGAMAYEPQPETTGKEEAFGFGDLIDMVNPLQHIPIISHIYRQITGDQIKPIGRIVGGALFGGFIGAGAGLVNMIAEHETGKDVTGNALSLVSGEGSFAKKAETTYTIRAYNAAKPRYNE